MAFERLVMLSDQFRNKLYRLDYLQRSLLASTSEANIKYLKDQRGQLVKEMYGVLEQIQQKLQKI